MEKKIFNILIIILIIPILFTSCSIVILYGKPKPDSVEKDKYTFKIGYNLYSSKRDCDQLAKKEIEKFKIQNRYVDYKIINSYDNYFPAYYAYEVKFFRSGDEWKSINISEKEIRSYFDMNIDNIEPIEGIWTNFDGSYKIGIKKNESDSKCDFVAIILESEVPTWGKGNIKIEFAKTAYKKVFSTKYYMRDRSKIGTTSSINENGILEIPLRLSDGRTTSVNFMKNYPVNIEGNFSGNFGSKNNISESTGSGFLLSETGLVITNFHVIEGKNEIEVFFPSKDMKINANIALKDKSNDLAILRLNDFNFSNIFTNSIPFTISHSSEIKLGQDVFTLGFPLGEILGKSAKLSTGTINSLYGIQDDPRIFQISNPIQPGNSGGPLFNKNGELVGIVVSTLNAKYFYENADIIPQNVNFAIKSDYLLNLISMLPEEDKIINRRNKLVDKGLENQIELLTPFIVNIKAK